MANSEHVEIVLQGAEAIADWRKVHPRNKLDLRYANLFAARLNSANLAKVKLAWANAPRARLSWANLAGAELVGTNFSEALLNDANLSETNLADASLTGAELSGTNLTGARCWSTSFGKCDLSQCHGLETVEHPSPSSIGTDTLVHTLRGAGGTFTEDQNIFFEGAGVPTTLLDYLPALVDAEPLKFYSTFISHGERDKAFAQRLYQDLTEHGVKSWLYEKSAVMGRGVWANIDQAIGVYDKLIVVCSEDSLQRRPVIREIERAIQKEDDLTKQGAKDTDILFPIRLDNHVLDGWEHPHKADVRAKNIGDFTDPAQYNKRLDELIDALDPRSFPLRLPK